MTAEDIEASKSAADGSSDRSCAQRADQGTVGIRCAFIFCFFFAKQIYNVLVWPFVWVRGRKTRNSFTQLSWSTL